MIQLRHAGIYVNNLYRETEFYKKVFHMIPIVEYQEQKDELISDLLDEQDGSVKFSKLVTEQGKANGYGDMIELLQSMKNTNKVNYLSSIFDNVHLAFGITDTEKTVNDIINMDGEQKTSIHEMSNGNKCCFCTDPEGNWLELIERKE